MSYVVLQYDFELVVLSSLNLHLLVQQFVNHYIISSIKETNWLIGKVMCVLLFDVFSEINKQVKECETFAIEKN